MNRQNVATAFYKHSPHMVTLMARIIAYSLINCACPASLSLPLRQGWVAGCMNWSKLDIVVGIIILQTC